MYISQHSLHDWLQVDLVLLPAVTGDFGVMPGHVPTVAQLRPGVVTIHTELDKDVEKYFVSSGFAFVHADSTADVVAVEAVKLDELDQDAVRAGLQVMHPTAGRALSCTKRSGYFATVKNGIGFYFAMCIEGQPHKTGTRSSQCIDTLSYCNESFLVRLQEYNAKLASVQAKGDDYEIAAAQIGVEVYSAMSSAVGA